MTAILDFSARPILTQAKRVDRPGPRSRGAHGAALAPNSARYDRRAIGLALGIGDASLTLLTAIVLLTALYPGPLAQAPLGVALPLALAAGALKMGLSLASAYDLAPAASLGARFSRVASGLGLGFGLGAAIVGVGVAEPALRVAGWAILVIGAGLIAGLHAVTGLTLRSLAKDGALAETAVIVGATEAAQRLIAQAARTGELSMMGVFDDRLARAPDAVHGVPVLGDLDDLLTWDQLPHADRVIVTVTSSANARVRMLLERLRALPNQVVLLLDLDDLGAGPAALGAVGELPAAFVSGPPRDARQALAKRIQDLVVGAAIAVLAAPVMALIAAAIALEGNGPILFRQQRHGFNNRVITVFKFRTMRHAPGSAGVVRQVEANDPRVSQLGHFLRTTSLDELPQLWNVLKGDMSLVGPRPHAVGMRTGQIESHRVVAEYAHRHRMKPGLTGWAQVNGSRGPLHAPEEVRERVKLDLDYIDRASFWFDLWIMARTAPALLGDKLRTR